MKKMTAVVIMLAILASCNSSNNKNVKSIDSATNFDNSVRSDNVREPIVINTYVIGFLIVESTHRVNVTKEIGNDDPLFSPTYVEVPHFIKDTFNYASSINTFQNITEEDEYRFLDELENEFKKTHWSISSTGETVSYRTIKRYCLKYSTYKEASEFRHELVN